MADSKLFYSKLFYKDLLIIEALRKSDKEAPKTTQQILGEVETQFKKFFPDETISEKTATISRHVHDMNQSKLYHIEVHKDNKRGYYNAGQILATEAACVIGAAIYQNASLTVDEKKSLLSKIKSATDIDGGSIILIFEKSLKAEEGLSGKDSQGLLPKIKTICKAIVESKKLTFNLRHDRITTESKQVTASPYFVFEKDNELFLAAKVGGSTKLSDFKVALMSNFEFHKENFESDKTFSLSQHFKGNSKDAPKVELKISFPESFIEKVIEQFGRNRIKRFAPIRKLVDGQYQYHATLSANESDGLYQWLRQNCNQIQVHSPISVKTNLKEQLKKALSIL